ncbi:MAG: NUDIX hydrolase [Candidatus Woesearchaeota archaeon]
MDFRIAVKAFVVKDERLLIIKRRSNDPHKPGVWDLPGGRLEPGEDPYKGLLRETKEEAGIEVEIRTVMNVHHFVRDDGQAITMLIFLCTANSEEVLLSEEHTDYEWIPIETCTDTLDTHFHEDAEIYRTHRFDLFAQRS